MSLQVVLSKVSTLWTIYRFFWGAEWMTSESPTWQWLLPIVGDRPARWAGHPFLLTYFQSQIVLECSAKITKIYIRPWDQNLKPPWGVSPWWFAALKCRIIFSCQELWSTHGNPKCLVTALLKSIRGVRTETKTEQMSLQASYSTHIACNWSYQHSNSNNIWRIVKLCPNNEYWLNASDS